ncbi:hypothetical protein FDF96_04650 [Clostridium botulinum]|nr:hypothetical protein [Clostridium botulinum]
MRATNSLDSKYQQHLESTEAKMKTLRATSEKLWMSFVHSSTINKAVGGLTRLVEGLNQIMQSSNGTKLAIVGLGISVFTVAKHFGGFVSALITGKGVIGGVSQNLTVFQTVMKLFTGAEITATTATGAFTGALTALKGAMLAILANPATWVFLGIASAIGVATYAIHKHIKKQQELKAKNEELTKSYKDLTTAMKNNDTTGMKSGADSLQKEQKKLQELIKVQKELKSNMANKKATFVTGGYVDVSATKLEQTNKAIKDQIELLKQNGFNVNENTGAILELSQAENQMKVNGFFEHVQGLAEEQIRYRKEIVALWKEYQTLTSIENKNESQKQRLVSVVDDLKRYMGDLTITTDENGNVVIRNTDLVGKQINMLDAENVSINDLIDVKIEHARQTEICETGMTNCVYSQVGARIQAYQDEINALNGLKSLYASSQWGALDNSLSQQFGLQSFGQQTDSNISKLQNEIKTLKDKEKNWNDQVAKVKSSFKVPSAPKHREGYFPSGGGKSKKSRSPKGRKTKSKHSKSETQYAYDGKAENIYDATIKTINNSLEKSDKLIDTISQKIANLQSLESKSNFKDILTQENEKLDAQRVKLDKLKSTQSQAESMKEQLKQKFYSNWSWMKGRDLESMSENEWMSLYNKYYGQTLNFGTGDGAKKKEEAYKKGAELFKELKKNYEDASNLAIESADKELKLEQEINTTVKERLEVQGKTFETELHQHQLAIDKKANELDVLRITEEKNYSGQSKIMTELLEKKERYLYHVVGIRDELLKQKNMLSENSTEWNLINEQIEEYNNKIVESNKNFLDQQKELKDLAKEKVKELLEQEYKNKERQLEKDNFRFTKEEWEQYQKDKVERIKKNIEKINQFVKDNGSSKYTDDALLAKQIELQMIESKRFDKLKAYQQEFEDIHNLRIKAIDDELDQLNKKNEKEKESEEREKRRIDLEKIRQQLENVRNEKNIQQLTKDENGLYQFVYVADQKKIDDLEDQLKKKQEENTKWQDDLEDKKKRKKLEDEKKYEEDLIKQKQEYHNIEKNKLDEHYSNMDALTKNYMNDLKSTYGDKWDEIISVLQNKLGEAKRLNEELKEIGSSYSRNQAEDDFLEAKARGDEKGAKKVRNKYRSSSSTSTNSSKSNSSGNSSASSSRPRVSSSDESSFLKAKASGDSKTTDSIRKKYASFKTGGYTGAWGKDGKIAVLHEKELILNKDETKNILQASKILKNLNPLSNITMPKLNLPSISHLGIINTKQPQVVKHIYQVGKIECPNVTNDNGINNLFDNLNRLGFQYDPEPNLS